MDNGSSVNSMPIQMLEKLGTEALKPIPWKCQGYNRNEKTPLGTVTLPPTLKDKIIPTNIIILNIDVNYNLLLGWPQLD